MARKQAQAHVESIGQANSVIESFAHDHGLGAGKCFELVPRNLLALTFGRVYTVATWGNVNCRNQAIALKSPWVVAECNGDVTPTIGSCSGTLRCSDQLVLASPDR